MVHSKVTSKNRFVPGAPLIIGSFQGQHLQRVYYYYHLLRESCSHQRQLIVLHWGLSDNKSPQVSRNLLSILAVLNNTIVKMVFNRPFIFKFSSPFNKLLVTVPKASIRIGMIFIFMFHSFFNSLTRSRYLYFFSLF